MKTKLFKPLVLSYPDGLKIIPAGTPVNLVLKSDICVYCEIDDLTLAFQTGWLCRYFSEFPCYTKKDVNRFIFSSVVPSIRGYRVEPDGHDPEGWPSILLADGFDDVLPGVPDAKINPQGSGIN